MLVAKPPVNIGDIVRYTPDGNIIADPDGDHMVIFIHLYLDTMEYHYQTSPVKNDFGRATWPKPFDDLVELPDVPITSFILPDDGEIIKMLGWSYTWVADREGVHTWQWAIMSGEDKPDGHRYFTPAVFNDLAQRCVDIVEIDKQELIPKLLS